MNVIEKIEGTRPAAYCATGSTNVITFIVFIGSSIKDLQKYKKNINCNITSQFGLYPGKLTAASLS